MKGIALQQLSGNPPASSTRLSTQAVAPTTTTRASDDGLSWKAPPIKSVTTIEEVIAQWVEANLDHGMPVALKDWPARWKNGHSTYSQRSLVYQAYNKLNSDLAAFEATFPQSGFGNILKAVRAAGQLAGTVKARKSKKRAA